MSVGGLHYVSCVTYFSKIATQLRLPLLPLLPYTAESSPFMELFVQIQVLPSHSFQISTFIHENSRTIAATKTTQIYQRCCNFPNSRIFSYSGIQV